MVQDLLTLLLNKWNYTSTDELETLNIDLTLLATEYLNLLWQSWILAYYILLQCFASEKPLQ